MKYFCALFLFLFAFSLSSKAYHLEIDGIYYNIIKYYGEDQENAIGHLSVTYNDGIDYGGYSGNIVIPDTILLESENQITKYIVTKIGENAFSYCPDLLSVSIPNTVTQIEDHAFTTCEQLTSMFIPRSITKIGYEAFTFCPNINYLIVEEGNPVYDSREECNAIIETATNTLVLGCTHTIIPNTVTAIGDVAFQEVPIESIEIPNSIKQIGKNAFENCYYLKSIEIPNSVTTIGDYAFNSCLSLSEITLPNSLTSIGHGTFEFCISISTVFSMIKEPFETSCWPPSGDLDWDNVVLFVPKGTKKKYENTGGWTVFKQIIEMDEQPTAVLEMKEETRKSEQIYDTEGRRLNNLQKGINIMNGRKVLVR